MSNRKLWISILRSSGGVSSSFPFYNQNTCRFFSRSSYPIRGLTSFTNSNDFCFLSNYSFSIKEFCSDSIANRCWNCNAVSASKLFLACESCTSVQPLHSSDDYFQIFGLERVYGIDDTHLETKYKNWQKKLHPDLVHSKSQKEKEYAAQQSARVIDAYRTLQKPLYRAIYLLRLEGIHVDEEKTVSEPELLMEMLEFREAVEDAGSPETLKQIQCQVQHKMNTWSKSFENAFKERKFEDAISSIQRMTYYHRINEEIVKKL